MAVISSIPGVSFDTNKPFYPLVMNYLASLFGLNELAGIGLIKAFGTLQGPNPELSWDAIVQRLLDSVEVSGLDMALVKEKLRKILGSLELRSVQQPNIICVKRDDVADDVASNPLSAIDALMRSAGGSLLILAYERCPDPSCGKWPDELCGKNRGKTCGKSSLWQFLRHCRNAAAHNGRFLIKPPKKGPLLLAEWSGFQIELAMDETELFKDGTGTGLLSPGDPLRLLWDIEQAYPNMSA